MPWFESRVARVRSYGKLVVALAAGFATLVGVTALFADRLGLLGVVVFTAILVGGFVGVLLLPETAWTRLTGPEDTFVSDLGRLHAEGVRLRGELPFVPDTDAEPLDAWEIRFDDWRQRVVAHLQPRWDGVFLSPIAPTGMRMGSAQYRRFIELRRGLDERLERLSQIMATVGGMR
jgi:hypothetical protein